MNKIEAVGKQAAAQLALLTHTKVEEIAAQKLHSRLEAYRKALSFKQEDDGVWIVHLESEADWIESGVKAHSMIEDLLNSPKAKTAADGSRYMCVPFAITSGKSGPTQTTNAQQQLVQAVKTQLKEAKIPFAKIQKDASGMPMLGTLHKLKLSTPKMLEWPKPGHGHGGTGWGAPGYPMIGATGIPFLAGARVTQSLDSKGKVQRGVITFRVVSSKHANTGQWFHPGLEPVNAFQQAYDWAMNELDKNIMPSIIDQISKM